MKELKKAIEVFKELSKEREDWEPSLQEIKKYILPFRGYFAEDGKAKDATSGVLNGSGMRAVRTMAAGLQSGLTSPAKPWFKLVSDNPELENLEVVKSYFVEVTRRLTGVFARSNLYNSLHSLYLEVAGFGTGAMMVVDDFHTGIRCRTFTAGEYMIGINSNLEVDKFARIIQMTTVQLVQEFGKQAVPKEVRADFEKGFHLDGYWAVFQTIYPNPDYDPKKKSEDNFSFQSVYWIGKNDPPLRVSGFHEFPVIVPRWDVVANQAYGKGPGWEALYEVRKLQELEEDGLVALSRMMEPTAKTPLTMRNNPEIRELPQIQHDLSSLRAYVADKEQKIRKIFLVDLFAQLTSYGGAQVTKEELRRKNEEDLILLEPALERMKKELLTPLIDRVYRIMERNGLFPELPDELRGSKMKVIYQSILLNWRNEK